MSEKKVAITLSKGSINFVTNLLNSGFDSKDKELDDVFIYNDIFGVIGEIVKKYREELKDKKEDEVEKLSFEKVTFELTPKQITFLDKTLRDIIKKGINVNEFTAQFIREIFTEISE